MTPFPCRAQGIVFRSFPQQFASLFRSIRGVFAAATVGIAAILLAAGSTTPVSAQQVTQVLQHHVRAAVSSHQAALVSRLPSDQQLHVSIVLPLRNQAALTSLLGRLYDPASPDYRKFLSVAEFTEQFGPTQADYDAVVAFATANGLSIAGTPANRLVVPVSGTTEQINQAFNVQMNVYQHPTEQRTFFSPDREPSLALAVPVAHISGLDDFSLPQPMLRHPAANGQQAMAVSGSGPGGSYLGSDMRAAYYGGSTLTGLGQAVGMLEFGGYLLSDVNATFSNAGQSYTVPVNNVLLDGATAGPLPQDDNGGEQTLDIVQAIGMAPGLSQVRVYIGIGSDDANILNSMASENIAKQLSCSWGWRPADPTVDDPFFQEMAAQGQSFFTASGDNGAFDASINPFFFPAEDVNVTTVGGTHLTTNGAAGTWASEVAWNSFGDGSGGGISPDNIPIPSWQAGLANSTNGGSLTLRNVPDVAMEGDFDNFACQLGNCAETWAGTSFAAPRWAGFMALVNQQAVEAGTAPAGGVGFINPQLYLIAQGAHAANDLHDIVSGNNHTGSQQVWFSTAPGYDLVTGWGSPTGQSLIDDLAGPQIPGFFIASSKGVLAVNPGGSASVNMTITDVGGFSGSVDFAVSSQLPSGVTASFSPSSTTGTTTLTVTASSSAAQSSTQVTVTGTSGNLSATTNFTLAVHAPSFALSTSQPSLGLDPGTSGSSTISVTPQFGFTGSVSLAASGLPAGVTAAFSPASTTGTSTLTLTVNSSAIGGTSPITITGTSGTLTATTTLSLTIHAPSFSLSNIGSLGIGQGGTISQVVFVNNLYGFNGSVNLVASSLPNGVTASFSPNPVTGGYTSMTLTASSTTPIGQSTVTITGTSGALSATTTFTLGVYAPTFALQSSGSVSVGQGTSGTAYVNVSPQYGFNSNVTLSVSGLPAGVTALWSPNPTTNSSTLTLAAASSAKAGQYPLTITGVYGAQTAKTTLNLTVATPTFTLSTYSVNLGQGTSSSTSVYVTPQYGFAGNVSLSLSGLPTGVTGTFSVNPTTGYSNLTLQASSTAAVGQYTATVTGTSGSQTVTTTLAIGVNAPTFTLQSIGTINVGRGTSTSGYVSVYSQNGFAGAVNLSVSGLPAGVTAVFSPNPTTYSSTLILTASSSAVLGQYTATITGTYGTQTVTTPLHIGVYDPTFTLSSNGNITIGQGTSTTTYTYVNAQYGFAGGVNFSVSGLPAGVTAAFSPNPTTTSSMLTLTASGTAAVGQYNLTITGTSGSQTVTTPLTLGVYAPSFTLYGSGSVYVGQGASANSYLYVNDQYGFTGNVNLSVSGLPNGVTASFATNPTTNSSMLTLTVSSSASVGTTTLTITGVSGAKTATTTLQLNVSSPSFSMSSGIYNLTLNAGASGGGYIYVYGQNGFSGSVTLAASGLPSGVTAAFSPNPTTGNSLLTLTASDTATAGTSTITVTGTSGASTTSTTFQLTISSQAYALTAAPSRMVIVPGNSASSMLKVTPANGFTGNVSLAASGLPNGVTATFSPTSTASGSTLTLTTTGTASPGTSTITITGTSGALTSSTTLSLVIQGSSVAATSTTLALTASGTAVSSVTAGTMVTAAATVKSGSTSLTAGQVNFCDAAALSCDSFRVIGSAQLTSAGTAVIHFVPGNGQRSYKAVFAGVTAYAPSASAASALTVTGSQPTSTTLAVSGIAGNYNLTGTVTGSGPSAPSGSLSFVDTTNGNMALGKATLTSGPATFSYGNSQSITLNSAPQSSATGDFNGDGIPDIAVVNPSSNNVSILLGKGDGTFNAPVNLTTSPNPVFVVIGDFNRDGNADLAVLSRNGNSVGIFLGNGDGTFVPANLSPQTGSSPVWLAIGDFNGDGFQDLATVNQYNSSVTILLGNGDGTFTPSSVVLPAGLSPTSIAVSDFNRDGFQDLAVTNQNSSTVMILLGNGDGTFVAGTAATVGQSPSAVAVADFNADGKQDLIVSSSSSTATVLLGNGDGTFTAGTNVGVGSYTGWLGIADLNQDGKPDLIATAYYSSTVTTLLGNGDGTFGPAVSSSVGLSYPSSVVVGDWNGDGIPDFAVTNNGGGTGSNGSLAVMTSALAQKATATATGVSPLGHGSHTVQANYPGDSAYLSSVSASTNLTASSGPPVVTLNLSASNITTAQSLTVTISVNGGTANPTPTGSVTLVSGSYTSTMVLTAGSAVITVPGSSLALGSDALSVNYVPDASSSGVYTNATGTASVTVTAGIGIATPTVTVTPSISTITNLQSATVSVAVSGVSGQPTPTGTVTLSSGSYTAQQTLSSGAASFTVAGSGLASGADTLTATYSGDVIYAGRNGTATLTVAPVLMAASAMQPISVGSSGNATLNFTAGGNYSGTMKLSCALSASPSGAQSLPGCSLNPASVTLTAGGNGSATLTVSTTAATKASLEPPSKPHGRGYAYGGTFLAVVLFLVLPAKRRRFAALTLLLGMIAAGVAGCASGSSGGSTPPPGSGSPGTTTGSYTFTVTATDSGSSVTASTNVVVNVQ
ncbi:MAG TPA: FG-GAP-like repeat-containing protein [Acidobacteriaceae bacterium]